MTTTSEPLPHNAGADAGSTQTSTAAVAAPRASHLQRNGIHYLQVAMLIGLLVVWEWFARTFNTQFWTSSPIGVAQAMYEWYRTGDLIADLKISLFEAGVGFVLGSIVGGLTGFVLGWIRRLGDVFEPFILSLYTLPKVALAPLFVLWFGIGVLNKVMFAGLLVFYMVFFTTFQGTRQVDRDLVENVRLLGATRFQTWTKIAIPYSAVWVFTGLRIGLPYALIGAIVGEFVASDAGVGFRIKEATSFFNTGAVFAGLVLLMCISITLLGILKLIERRALRWQTADTLNKAALETHE